MTFHSKIFIGVLIVAAAAGGFFAAQYFAPVAGATPTGNAGTQEREIAYWQAPMDPSFRSDKPGKSPMGMDLIPVYADDQGSSDEPSVRINPAVVNNIGVRTELVMRSHVAHGIETLGTIRPDDELRSDIHTRTEGWVERLYVESEGENVRKGQILFEIYAPSLVTAQSEYLQTVKIGRESFIRAGEERLRSLGMTEGQIKRLRKSGEVKRRVAVYAPHDGFVMDLMVREGMFLKPSNTAMQLADLTHVWLIADVFENQSADLEVGQKAVMTLAAYPGEEWQGVVDYIYPTAVSETRTVRVRARFSNEDGRLKPNMFARVSIMDETTKPVVSIPASALIRTSKGDRVILALGEGRFRPARVVAGTEARGKVEILKGLNSGERIVTSGQFLIDSEASLDPALLRLSAPNGDEMGEMDMNMVGEGNMEEGALALENKVEGSDGGAVLMNGSAMKLEDAQ